MTSNNRCLAGILGRGAPESGEETLRPPLIIMATSSIPEPAYGALVISLDFELHWGVRHTLRPDGPYRSNLLGARIAVPRLLDLFEEFGAGVTWATVGFLFPRTSQQPEECSPPPRP